MQPGGDLDDGVGGRVIVGSGDLRDADVPGAWMVVARMAASLQRTPLPRPCATQPSSVLLYLICEIPWSHD